MRQVVAGLREASMLIPIEAVASSGVGITVGGIVYRQVQRHDAVAA